MIDVEVLASAKQVIDQPLSGGGGSNRYCADFVSQAEDNGENAQSVGILARFGEFRVLHLGDMTVNTEFQLMCSDNPIGTVDLFVVSHHGQPEAMRVLYPATGLEDLWQLHFSQLSGQEYTVPGLFIANPVDEALSAMPIAPMPSPQRGPGVPPPASSRR